MERKIISLIFMLFISLTLYSQTFEKIGPYTVWFNYQTKITENVKYTVKGPLIHLKRKGIFYKSNGTVLSSDYTNSGYDKGHMYPCDLAQSYSDMHASFNLKNSVPQDPSLNRGLWKVLESRVSKLTKTNDSIQVMIDIYGLKEMKGKLYVPLYFTKQLKIWNDGTFIIETYTFKNENPIYTAIDYYKVKN